MSGREIARFVVLAVIIGACVAAGLYAVANWPTQPEDFDFDDTGPRLVALSALAIVFLASLVFGQPKVRDILKGIVFWGGLTAVLVTGYTYRAELVQGGYRVLGALAPGLAVTQEDGTILIVRDASGHFVLDGKVNEAPVHFLLDTGASAVVLTYEDARKAGFLDTELVFRVPVSTANGRALVAPIRISEIHVGDATFRNIRGFVAREGALENSLFGMTALDRLQRWHIEGDKLVMVP